MVWPDGIFVSRKTGLRIGTFKYYTMNEEKHKIPAL